MNSLSLLKVIFCVLIVIQFLFLVYIVLLSWLKCRGFLSHSSSGDASDLQLQSTTAASGSRRHTQGLNESVINIIPSLIYSTNNEEKESQRECSVCLGEFKDNDYIRTLPSCSHTFHLRCIDTWLRLHPNCPLCRSSLRGCVRSELPFRPLMSDRIRPSSVQGQ
ncbi:RING-H2 finger protein ATL65-like [Vicia villosa]|uniref:RING-H2 finger protein ATL65-like n=1 Tax=Vicia villosa TaxID=3911 RepID=UPI00273B38C0|nr:RING-H2 finger protein ATL65-like [Vicia villosa]